MAELTGRALIASRCAKFFKNGDFGSIIKTPLGNIGVAICYDAKRKHFYNNIHDEKLSMILFPHGCPADPTKQKRRRKY